MLNFLRSFGACYPAFDRIMVTDRDTVKTVLFGMRDYGINISIAIL
jgi:hypothetical protein